MFDKLLFYIIICLSFTHHPKQADLLETRVIDGRSCLLIPIEGNIAVNGQPVFANR